MYQLPKLPYLFQDFEPYIDTHTMGIHYNKHHRNYLIKLNELLIKNNYDFRYELTELFYHINEFPATDQEEILFNLGGVLNHNIYWKSIKPEQQQKPQGQLKRYIEKKYGSYKNLWNLIKGKALQLKGSGYTFLVLKSNADLEIINTPNQVTPLSLGYIPLLNIDLWEHAYYLNYENERARYLDNIKEIIDFSNANKVFNSIIK